MRLSSSFSGNMVKNAGIKPIAERFAKIGQIGCVLNAVGIIGGTPYLFSGLTMLIVIYKLLNKK